LPRWRKGTWIILAFNLLMLNWIIGGAHAAQRNKDCGSLNQHTCDAATDIGTAIGVSVIIALWVAGDSILGIIWLVTNRSKTRECPACGTDVKKGLFACMRCGYDFRAAR
jgi:hypothetical protein